MQFMGHFILPQSRERADLTQHFTLPKKESSGTVTKILNSVGSKVYRVLKRWVNNSKHDNEKLNMHAIVTKANISYAQS